MSMTDAEKAEMDQLKADNAELQKTVAELKKGKKKADTDAKLAAAGFKPEDIDIVLCTHLHFDHVGSIRRFDGVALPDVPVLRTRAVDGALTLTRYEFLGAMDHLAPPTFQVNEW